MFEQIPPVSIRPLYIFTHWTLPSPAELLFKQFSSIKNTPYKYTTESQHYKKPWEISLQINERGPLTTAHDILQYTKNQHRPQRGILWPTRNLKKILLVLISLTRTVDKSLISANIMADNASHETKCFNSLLGVALKKHELIYLCVFGENALASVGLKQP